MLKSFVDQKHFCFHQRFDSWKDAIYAGAQPLVDDGTVEKVYVDEIIKAVETYGPYIVIDPGRVAMPHSTLGGTGVHDTTICFMKVEEPVAFDPDDRSKDAKLFFTLAAINSEEHLQNMMKLADLLSNEDLVNDLMEAKSPEDLLKLHEKYNKD